MGTGELTKQSDTNEPEYNRPIDFDNPHHIDSIPAWAIELGKFNKGDIDGLVWTYESSNG